MLFINAYEDAFCADSYSRIEFPGCYYLAYRDLPKIISQYSKTGKAIDFGCGAGRSTRFLKRLGYNAVGIDISQNMIKKAKELDPHGNYQLIKDDCFSNIPKNEFDLVLSVFTFDNIPDEQKRINLLKELSNLLKEGGIIICLDSTPEIYINEWASFSTKDFPENKFAKSGDRVKIINTEMKDNRPVEDIFWKDKDYKRCFKKAGLELIHSHKTYGKIDEPFEWINETKIAPWIIYVLKKDSLSANSILENYFGCFNYSHFW